MAVQNQTPVASFTTSGVTTVFPFAFMLLDADDLVVTLDGVTVSSGFSIAGIGAPAGGSVVFTTAPAAGQMLVLRRNIALQRLNDYQRNGDLLAQVLNLDLDRIWQALQGLRLDATRALKLPEDTLTDQTITDDAAGRAGKLVGFDGSGNAVAVNVATPGALLVSAFIEGLLPSANAAAARAVLGAVGTSGTDTIAGAKTFISPVTIPDGVNPEHAASVGQLEAEEIARDVAIAAALDPALVVPTLSSHVVVATTSGTEKELSGSIPAWATEVVITILGMSTNGTSEPRLLLGDSSGYVTSGYSAVGSTTAGSGVSTSGILTSGFDFWEASLAATIRRGVLRLDLADPATNTWMLSAHMIDTNSARTNFLCGTVSLSGSLSRIKITTAGGVNTFDAGKIGLRWR